MAGAQAVSDRNLQVFDNPEDDLLERVSLVGRLHAVHQFAKDDAAHALQLSRELQLHQHAVDLVGLGGDVFQEKQLAFGFRFVGRAQRGDQDRKTSAIEHTLAFSGDERIEAEDGVRGQLPLRVAAQRGTPGILVHAGRIGFGEILGDHRTVKGHQAGGVV